MATDFRTLLKHIRGNPRNNFSIIHLGSYGLSIQASGFHHSEPREYGLDPHDYEKFEVALFKDEKYVRFRPGDEGLLHGPWIRYIERIEDICFLSYCPVEVVQALYDKVEELSHEA